MLVGFGWTWLDCVVVWSCLNSVVLGWFGFVSMCVGRCLLVWVGRGCLGVLFGGLCLIFVGLRSIRLASHGFGWVAFVLGVFDSFWLVLAGVGSLLLV